MSFHWKVLIWMAAGALLGIVLQLSLAAPTWVGIEWTQDPGGVQVSGVAAKSSAKKVISTGDVFSKAVLGRGAPDELVVELDGVDAFEEKVLARTSNGQVVWMLPPGVEPQDEGAVPLAVALDPESTLMSVVAPFTFAADIFLALLKMLIVPLVLSSIVTGVAGVGSMKDLRRLGGKTFIYYLSSSILAILVGQLLVNLIKPGEGASLGLSAAAQAGLGTDDSFIDVLKRAIPQNIFASLQDNGAMLSIIFFALLLGYFITQTEEPHSGRIKGIFQSFFEVMMKMAEGVLKLLPYGVFALLVKVTATMGFEPFEALLLYMLTVASALLLHACVTLPMLLKTVGRMSPARWAKAMSPALMTAFSTSSSSMTLPVTMRTVEHRGRVSNKVTSFTLPLGATINMDGTALYECIGVIFLAQYYASVGAFTLGPADQAFVVILALLASIGAAGIPSAGLVMMLTILSALKLPVEGAALLLAVDRPLDMMRTVVNVWSDSCGAAVVARTEGEEGPLEPVTVGG